MQTVNNFYDKIMKQKCVVNIVFQVFRTVQIQQIVIEKTRIIPYYIKPNVDIKIDNGNEIYFNGSNYTNLMTIRK